MSTTNTSICAEIKTLNNKGYICTFKHCLSLLTLFLLFSCSESRFGELNEGKRRKWSEPTPFGMQYINQGSFILGPNDQDVRHTNAHSKTVSIDAFWMDDSEITNNEYRQFVEWVKESMARQILAERFPEFMITEDKAGNPIQPPKLNWEKKLNWNDPEHQQALEEIYYSEEERFYGRKEIDTRKLAYEYWWIDYSQAAKRRNSYNFDKKKYEGNVYNSNGEFVPISNRSSFFMHNYVYIYPDTLCWSRDFTYSYNDPRTTHYYSYPAFDYYPVVGVSWEQANAFCHWRTQLQNNYLSKHKKVAQQNYRLPTEAEWEYASRGKKQSSMYSWGGYYTRTQDGNFIANFKPLRGNYMADGSMATKEVRSYDANDFGLYDMAGNVAEWTSNAYNESAYSIIHDFNPNFEYNARPDDPPVMKRKVVRGGSWKDASTFIQTGTRDFEYQDSVKSYIGFRCVKSSFCEKVHM